MHDHDHDHGYPLIDLFQRGLPKPAALQDSPDGCGLIVLACHCFMVHDGFNSVPSGQGEGASSPKQSAYHLPKDWDACQHRDYWELKYTKEGSNNEFLLEVALRRATGQILVSVSELRPGEVGGNVQRLGLQLSHYVPDATVLKSQAWEDILSPAAQGRLSGLWYEHIARPLAANSAAESPFHRSSGRSTSAYRPLKVKSRSPSSGSSGSKRRMARMDSLKPLPGWQDCSTSMVSALCGAAFATAIIGGVVMARRMLT